MVHYRYLDAGEIPTLELVLYEEIDELGDVFLCTVGNIFNIELFCYDLLQVALAHQFVQAQHPKIHCLSFFPPPSLQKTRNVALK